MRRRPARQPICACCRRIIIDTTTTWFCLRQTATACSPSTPNRRPSTTRSSRSSRSTSSDLVAVAVMRTALPPLISGTDPMDDETSCRCVEALCDEHPSRRDRHVILSDHVSGDSSPLRCSSLGAEGRPSRAAASCPPTSENVAISSKALPAALLAKSNQILSRRKDKIPMHPSDHETDSPRSHEPETAKARRLWDPSASRSKR